MKIIVTLFWSFAVGQVVGYIMTALAGVPDNELWTTVVSLFFGLFVWLIATLAIGKSDKTENEGK